MMLVRMRVLLGCCCCYIVLTGALTVAAAEDESPQRAAAKRVLAGLLARPHIHMGEIIHDAQTLFPPSLLSDDELKQLVMKHADLSEVDLSNKELDQLIEKSRAEVPKEEDGNDDKYYADRHIKRMALASTDNDCMEREFDASSPDFNVTEAALVFSKCRLVVLRNVWATDTVMRPYKNRVSNYLSNLHEGQLDRTTAQTTTGEELYVQREEGRFDVLLPQYLVVPEVVSAEPISSILAHPQVLKDDYIVNTVGCVLTESNTTEPGDYHYDEDYLWGTNALEDYGVAGTDVPPYAVTMFVPLLNTTTLEHGPTEFCMGTQHPKGTTRESPVRDESLWTDNIRALLDFEEEEEQQQPCPSQNLRIPLLHLGDALLFDFTLTHRAGANTSPDLRAMQYISYSRPWYRDSNFQVVNHNNSDDDDDADEVVAARCALVKELEQDCSHGDDACQERVPLESIQNLFAEAAQSDDEAENEF